MFFDYHMHSTFSADSKMRLEEICEQSIAIGLEEIAITDHHDLDYQDPNVEFVINRPRYLAAIEEMQQKYAGRLTIKKGLELGLQLHLYQKCEEFVGDHFDFVLASFHTVQKKDLYNGDFFLNYNQWQAYREYLKEILQAVQNFQHFSVIGHLDVIRRYGDFSQVPDLTEDPVCYELLEQILKTVIDKGKGLEVNTSGYHVGNKLDPLPTRKILKLYHQLGGKIITIGSDSHQTKRLGYRIKETQALLHQIGFRYLTTFEQGKPIYHRLNNQ